MTAGVMLPCPVPGCTRRRSVQYMMCRPDWWRVSPATRAEVYARWAAFAADPAAYEAIRLDAIAEAVASRHRAAE